MARDTRTLKRVIGKVHAESSYKVIYRVNGDRYGMYVWAEDSDDAKREVLQRVSGAVIENVKLGRPGEAQG